ncbi:MAG: leucine-rich repeat domain-containing protein [Clostridia bacterium]|nr:leucine-rich repeat domain-containing protein [Clostridia bacterium]
MKNKLLLVTLVALISVFTIGVIATSAATIIDSGNCGTDGYYLLVWILDVEGTLSITGTGKMSDYDYNYKAPWDRRRDRIVEVIIGEDVTSIGSWSFDHCERLESVEMPNSVTKIGEYAFAGCYRLKNVEIPDSVTSIGLSAFANCHSLKNVEIPGGITGIYGSTFNGCVSLVSVSIPVSVTSIGDHAFFLCENLTDVYYNGTEEQWNNITVGEDNEPLLNATIHFVEEETEVPVDYKINSISIEDMSGNSLDEIPTGNFLATVSITNVSSSEDAVVVLAQYSASGAFKGLMYIQTEDVPAGSTIKLSIPVDNKNGDVAMLKAFCWASLGSLTPIGEAVSFPVQ